MRRVVLLVIAAIYIVFLIRFAKDVLLPLVAAHVFAAVLRPVASMVRRFVPWNTLASGRSGD